jgi:hypothetical protein
MTGSVPSRQLNIAHDSGIVIAAQGGGRVDVHQRIGTHLIDELSFGAVPPLADEQPSRLLNAANRVVRFTGRTREIAELERWRDDSAAVAVRLMHGGAGQGKTRLAHRFAELSGAAGWITLRARHSRDIAIRPIDVQPGDAVVTAGPILVVVDYAERWPLSDLLALLVDRRLHGSRALRVLLLARPVGNWWYALTHRLWQDLGVSAVSVELATLGAVRGDSEMAFAVARGCFAEALRVAVPEAPVPDIEGSILTIHMAALAHVLAVRVGDTPPSDPGELSAYLLSREIAVLDPAAATLRLEEFSPHNIAVILLAVDPRHEWLVPVFRGLDPVNRFAVLREFVWFDGLTRHPVILRFVGKQLLNRTAASGAGYAVSVLQNASAAVVAGVLGHRDWADQARLVLGYMDRSRASEIVRLLSYHPGEITYHDEQTMYW